MTPRYFAESSLMDLVTEHFGYFLRSNADDLTLISVKLHLPLFFPNLKAVVVSFVSAAKHGEHIGIMSPSSSSVL